MDSEKKRVAIFGGSFNPIHRGHVSVAEKVFSSGFADEVWLMPCKKHSFDKSLEDFDHRAEMIKLAIAGKKGLKFSDFELTQEGKSYTIDTLTSLRNLYDYDFHFIIGADILGEIHKWKRYPELAKEAKFIVFLREGYEFVNPGINIISLLNLNEKNISASEIREKILRRESISELVHTEVENYMKENNLYRNKID